MAQGGGAAVAVFGNVLDGDFAVIVVIDIIDGVDYDGQIPVFAAVVSDNHPLSLQFLVLIHKEIGVVQDEIVPENTVDVDVGEQLFADHGNDLSAQGDLLPEMIVLRQGTGTDVSVIHFVIFSGGNPNLSVTVKMSPNSSAEQGQHPATSAPMMWPEQKMG